MRHLFVALCLVFPVLTVAHTSDERYVDGYIVDLGTAPVAPWVGEKMGMNFTFRDPLSGRATTSVLSARMEFDALMRVNKKPPETTFRSDVYRVTDGGFATDYTFLEEGTYDIHLTFTDTNGGEHLAGFRKQIRSGDALSGPGVGPLEFFGAIGAVALLAFLAGRYSSRQ